MTIEHFFKNPFPHNKQSTKNVFKKKKFLMPTYRNLYIDGCCSDLTVTDDRVVSIEPADPTKEFDDSIDCNGSFWALPAMVNMHTHSAMTLFRSAGSGLPLQPWLHEVIFPREAQLTPDDVFMGVRQACDEMRASGTLALNDMYFHVDQAIRAVCQAHMEGNIALSVTDNDFNTEGEFRQLLSRFDSLQQQCGDDITLTIAPHSIYAVNAKHLQYLADFTHERNLPYHIHISETQAERENCIRQNGVPPVVWLDRLGILDKTQSCFIGAHALWLDDTEIALLGERHCNVVHCPNSNLKLGSGCRFRYVELRDAGVNVTLGTDGCASSDNLDLLEAMKVMSLLQKGTRQDPSVLPSHEVFQVATANGWHALHRPHRGLKPGDKARFFLVDINRNIFSGVTDPQLSPSQRQTLFLDRLIYAAHSDTIHPIPQHHTS
jgi:5-methylthioadenosine/S-adenosylhomocysteine deaminase